MLWHSQSWRWYHGVGILDAVSICLRAELNVVVHAFVIIELLGQDPVAPETKARLRVTAGSSSLVRHNNILALQGVVKRHAVWNVRICDSRAIKP